jgi:hypothetical protein
MADGNRVCLFQVVAARAKCYAPDNYADAVVAADLDTGEVK